MFSFCKHPSTYRPDSVVIMEIATGWTVRGSNFGRENGIFSSLKSPDLPWGPLRLLFNGYRSSFRRLSSRGLMLTNYVQLQSRLRMNGAIQLLPPYAIRA